MQGTLSKLKTVLDNPVQYTLPVGEARLPLNNLIGTTLTLRHTGQIFCTHCGRKTKTSFNQGHCYPCFKKLARCDTCIIKPEQCHYAEGTCREPEWGESFCFQPHYVYLANSSGIKVGITRDNQIPTRWIDQGAIQALPVFKVQSRLQSGLVEVIFARLISDKTNWRAMLKGNVSPLNLAERRDHLFVECEREINLLKQRYGDASIQHLEHEDTVSIHYPVIQYPTKVSSFNFDKQPEVRGKLVGIKGQYLIFDSGVINIRKFTAYEIAVE